MLSNKCWRETEHKLTQVWECTGLLADGGYKEDTLENMLIHCELENVAVAIHSTDYNLFGICYKLTIWKVSILNKIQAKKESLHCDTKKNQTK